MYIYIYIYDPGPRAPKPLPPSPLGGGTKMSTPAFSAQGLGFDYGEWKMKASAKYIFTYRFKIHLSFAKLCPSRLNRLLTYHVT